MLHLTYNDLEKSLVSTLQQMLQPLMEAGQDVPFETIDTAFPDTVFPVVPTPKPLPDVKGKPARFLYLTPLLLQALVSEGVKITEEHATWLRTFSGIPHWTTWAAALAKVLEGMEYELDRDMYNAMRAPTINADNRRIVFETDDAISDECNTAMATYDSKFDSRFQVDGLVGLFLAVLQGNQREGKTGVTDFSKEYTVFNLFTKDPSKWRLWQSDLEKVYRREAHWIDYEYMKSLLTFPIYPHVSLNLQEHILNEWDQASGDVQEAFVDYEAFCKSVCTE
jgi:hypothetical protein